MLEPLCAGMLQGRSSLLLSLPLSCRFASPRAEADARQRSQLLQTHVVALLFLSCGFTNTTNVAHKTNASQHPEVRGFCTTPGVYRKQREALNKKPVFLIDSYVILFFFALFVCKVSEQTFQIHCDIVQLQYLNGRLRRSAGSSVSGSTTLVLARPSPAAAWVLVLW